MLLRFILGCLFLAASAAPFSPGSRELHRWYGEPILERFTARPGINVTVEYGSDRMACEVRISPAHSMVEEEQFQAAIHGQRSVDLQGIFQRMSSAVVTELVEQIAPTAIRGKAIGSGMSQASCGALETDEYENVIISRGVGLCEPKEQAVSEVSISFKRNVCPKSESTLGFKFKN
jgi:hypothetical protein